MSCPFAPSAGCSQPPPHPETAQHHANSPTEHHGTPPTSIGAASLSCPDLERATGPESRSAHSLRACSPSTHRCHAESRMPQRPRVSQPVSPGQQGQTSTSSSSSSPCAPWNLKRPVLSSCPKLQRRQLRALNRPWTLADVRQHAFSDDAWIAVDGKVYDITEHITDHPGWDTGCGISTILSILAHAGTECTAEFNEIHRAYPVAFKQLRAYYIGDLATE